MEAAELFNKVKSRSKYHPNSKKINIFSNGCTIDLTKKSIKKWAYNGDHIVFTIAGGRIWFKMPVVITEEDFSIETWGNFDYTIGIKSDQPVEINKFIKLFQNPAEEVDYNSIPEKYIVNFDNLYKDKKV